MEVVEQVTQGAEYLGFLPCRINIKKYKAWARTYITTRNPLTEPQTMPDLPEPTPEALQ